MDEINDRSQIRRVLFVWGVLTLLYFFTTWGVVQFIAHETQERIFAALAITVTYSVIAVSLGQDVMRQTAATNRALQASVANQHATEEQLRRELAERQRAEQQLKETLAEIERAQTKANAIFDAATDSMMLLASNQIILAVNRSFCEQIFGTNPRQVFGHHLAEYQADAQRAFDPPAAFQELIDQTITDTERSFTQVITQRAPQHRVLQLYSTPVRTKTGENLGRLYVFRDVTQEHEVDRMKSEFVSMVSHELRTPLTSIKGYVDLLQAGEVGALTSEQREFLDIVKTSTDRLVELINELLDISRIEAGRVELKLRALDLPRLIR